jgi:ribose 5-phosphate isomerase B
MLIYIGSDHKGFQLKESIKKFLDGQGYEVVDVGNDHYDENDDYPDFARAVAEKISENPTERRGILICGSGVGVDVVANKFGRVRSALANSPDQASASRHDDDSNVLSLAADFIDETQVEKIIGAWLVTPFSGEENHQRRMDKIIQIEMGK